MSISQITSDEEITVGETSTNLLRDERIVLNVGGIKYETYRSTLTAYPETLLGTMFHQRNREMLHPTNGNEYFIDRNGYAFYYILEFYRTGKILWKDDILNISPFSFSSILPQNIDINNISNNGSTSGINVGSNININNLNDNNNNNGNVNIINGLNQQQKNYFTSHLNHISLPDLEQEFSYFQIPFTSKHDLAEKAAGELLDDFAYAIEELLCLAISKLVDRISITFYRDGSKVECKLIDNNNNNNNNSNLLSSKYFNTNGNGSIGVSVGAGVGAGVGSSSSSSSNSSNNNNNNNNNISNININNDFANENNNNLSNNNSTSSVNNISNDNNNDSDNNNNSFNSIKGNIIGSRVINNFSNNYYYSHRLNDYSLNGYCIINHFFEDIKKYLENNFSNMIIKLDFGNNYKSLTLSMSRLFTRNTIKKHSKIGMLTRSE